jgi:lantibiotic modifying enzyme
MNKIKKVEKEIKEIDNKIYSLEKQKKRLLQNKEMVYCPICKKAYPSDKCRQGPEMSGGFLEAWNITCPKGHTWDDK